MPLLSKAEVHERLKGLEGWFRQGNAIRKEFVFAGFAEAVAFVSRLVPEAERANHHPDLTINYKTVTVSYTTHSKGGLTEKDFTGARMADGKARGQG